MAFKMPNLGNATPAFLTDELGKTRDQLKDLKKLEGIYKGALTARLAKDQTGCEGELYQVEISTAPRTSLDTSLVREEMGDDWYSNHCRTTDVTTIRTKKKD